MKKCQFWAAIAVLASLVMPNLAGAQTTAFAVPGSTNMRAGPGQGYPVVARILGGSVVNIIGCLSDFSWCDSTVQGIRGWVSTSRLEFVHGGARVAFPLYRTYFRAPVIRFDLGYWDRYYRDRPFYRERRRGGGGGVYIDPDQHPNTRVGSDARGRRDRGGVYIDPDQNPNARVGSDARGRQCSVRGADGRTVVAPCP